MQTQRQSYGVQNYTPKHTTKQYNSKYVSASFPTTGDQIENNPRHTATLRAFYIFAYNIARTT